jgi:DegV family protein with EDD domain
MGNRKIVVVTDSSAYIPDEALGDLHIPVIPLWVIWGDDRFRDGVDIDPPAFYQRLQTDSVFPTTSQPSAGEFLDFFRQVGAEADGVVGIFVTSKLSGTVANAQAAEAELTDVKVRVVDSLSTSMALGFIVLAAARAAAAGGSLDQVVAAAKEMRDRAQLIFVVDTLEYLHRGGRIGGAKWLMGAALNIKPLLHITNGTIEPLAQVRTKPKAIARMLDAVEARLGGKRMAEAAVIDASCAEEGDALAEQVRERFGISPVYRTVLSPAIGVHGGPGTVGVVFYAER